MRNKKLIALFFVLCAFAVLIVVNSVLFSVQNIYAVCFNHDPDSDFDGQIALSSNITMGSSIFMLDEQQVIQNIETTVGNIRIINIERKFPGTVYINYVRVEDYLKIRFSNKIYYISNSGQITKIANAADDIDDGLVEFIPKGIPVDNLELSSYFATDDPSDEIYLRTLLSALERIMLRSDFLHMFEFIDVTKGYIYLKTTTGAYFELISADYAFEKLRAAYSVYLSFGAGATEHSQGTFIITGRDKNNINVTYDNSNRYLNGIELT